MPSFPAGTSPASIKNFSVSLIDYRGETGTVSVNVPATVTQEELETLAVRVGGVSNAGLYAYTTTEKDAISPAVATAYDDNEGSVSVKAELVFIDNNLQTRSFSIPAPDAQFVGEDGVSITNTGGMALVISQLLLILNGGAGATPPGGTFAFARGYIVTKSRKTKRGNTRPNFTEPGILPPTDAPAT